MEQVCISQEDSVSLRVAQFRAVQLYTVYRLDLVVRHIPRRRPYGKRFLGGSGIRIVDERGEHCRSPSPNARQTVLGGAGALVWYAGNRSCGKKQQDATQNGRDLDRIDLSYSSYQLVAPFPLKLPPLLAPAYLGGRISGNPGRDRCERRLQKRSVNLLASKISRPEKQQGYWNEPICEQQSERSLDEPRRRRIGIHPPKMRAQQADDDTRLIVSEFMPIWENRWQFLYRFPKLLQMKMKQEVTDEQSGRNDQVRFRRR